MMKPLHIHTRAQNHPDKQKSHKSRYMSRIGGCSPALAAMNITPPPPPPPITCSGLATALLEDDIPTDTSSADLDNHDNERVYISNRANKFLDLWNSLKFSLLSTFNTSSVWDYQ